MSTVLGHEVQDRRTAPLVLGPRMAHPGQLLVSFVLADGLHELHVVRGVVAELVEVSFEAFLHTLSIQFADVLLRQLEFRCRRSLPQVISPDREVLCIEILDLEETVLLSFAGIVP